MPDLKIYILSAAVYQDREGYRQQAEEAGADGIYDRVDDFPTMCNP